MARRPAIKGVRLRLALALVLVVAGVLAVVALIVVPSLEDELVDAKLEQLETDARTISRGFAGNDESPQAFAEFAASIVQARVVIYAAFDELILVQGDSNPGSSVDVDRARRRCARRRRAGCSGTRSSATVGSSPRWGSRSPSRRP